MPILVFVNSLSWQGNIHYVLLEHSNSRIFVNNLSNILVFISVFHKLSFMWIVLFSRPNFHDSDSLFWPVLAVWIKNPYWWNQAVIIRFWSICPESTQWKTTICLDQNFCKEEFFDVERKLAKICKFLWKHPNFVCNKIRVGLKIESTSSPPLPPHHPPEDVSWVTTGQLVQNWRIIHLLSHCFHPPPPSSYTHIVCQYFGISDNETGTTAVWSESSRV